MYIDNYMIYLSTIKNRSDKTIKEYERDINEFLSYVNKDIKNIDINDGRKFLVYCSDNGNTPKTRARKVSAIRGFFTYLAREKGIDSNIVGLEKPKLEKTLPKYLTIDESRELLAISNVGENKERNYLIISLFLNCGLRLSELANIKVRDIKDNSLVVYGKGSKERMVFLNDSVMVALVNYLKVRECDNEYLFVSNRGMKLGTEGISQMVKSNLQKIGKGDLSTHKLRHSCATMFYENGIDILTIKEILGHESVATTQIYTHIQNEQVKNAMFSSPLIA